MAILMGKIRKDGRMPLVPHGDLDDAPSSDKGFREEPLYEWLTLGHAHHSCVGEAEVDSVCLEILPHEL
jgi:hypothetical protein